MPLWYSLGVGRRGEALEMEKRMSKTHVAVLMGGMSSEHDISIKSGTKVLENLSAETFEITKVTISREGPLEGR